MAARLCSSLLQSSLAIVFVSLLVLGVMEGMSPFASLLMQWSKAGTAIGTNDWKQTGPIVEAAKSVLLSKAKSLVASARLRPILFCYGCDGTPIRLTGTFVSSFGGAAVRRRGGDGQELLIQRGYVITKDSLGDLTSAAIIRDLLPLSEGKGSWNCLTAATRFFPHLRELGAQSITITSTCFDRALQSSMSRMLAQRQALYYEVKYGADAYRGDALFEVLTDWSVATGCSAHDAQNALKWGMVGCVADTAETLKGAVYRPGLAEERVLLAGLSLGQLYPALSVFCWRGAPICG